jgi:ATP-binding cassette, subfamily C, bacterial
LTNFDTKKGRHELYSAQLGQMPLIWSTLAFSVFINLLHLTGPLYMMQVYDRVLGSRSESTLVVLTVLITGLFLVMGILEHARARILARVGAHLQNKLDRRVFAAAMQKLTQSSGDINALTAQRDLETIQRVWSSQLLVALFDLPWTPLFVIAMFIFHPALGVLALGGGLILVTITLINQNVMQQPQGRVNSLTMHAERMSDMIKLEAEPVRALGMTGAAFDRWQKSRSTALIEGIGTGDLAGKFATTSKTFRMFLQSAMLGLGAYLVLQGQITGGAMIAASMLMGRALQPIEMVVGQWPLFSQGIESFERLSTLLTQVPAPTAPLALPRPRAVLEAQNISVVPPGEMQPALKGVSFSLKPGQALGIIGPSGAGKSTLARALIGVWHPAAGKVRLDGASLDQYDPDVLGSYFGYLPQRVGLFEGTIAENIARLQEGAKPEDVVSAAKRAAAHDMIVRLPDGYDTKISTLGGRLSGGQIQRIGLARALYGNPIILVLDEPNSNLDNDGTLALNQAIRTTKEAGGVVLIMAHRPAAIQECDLLLVLEDGARRAFGPRDQVLREMVKNHTEIVRSTGAGGVS